MRAVAPRAADPWRLQPQMVFFGGVIPATVAMQAQEEAAKARLVVAVGTTLQAYSAFKLVRAAAANGAQIALVNRGPTRADDLANAGMFADSQGCGPFLQEVLAQLRSS
jgi:NAD-dependent SIR2 family protein deacetylase